MNESTNRIRPDQVKNLDPFRPRPKGSGTPRAALVTLGPSWPGDHKWTGHYIFSSAESARRYFDTNPNVLSIKPDNDSEFFTPFDETLTREDDAR